MLKLFYYQIFSKSRYVHPTTTMNSRQSVLGLITFTSLMVWQKYKTKPPRLGKTTNLLAPTKQKERAKRYPLNVHGR